MKALPAGERLGTVHGHCLERDGFAGERLGMSSSCLFCFLCLKIGEALRSACVSMLCLLVEGRQCEHGEDEAMHATLQYVQCVFGDVCMRCGDDCSGMRVMSAHV